VEKEECPECGKTRVLDENYGVCKKCVKEYYDDFEEE
jgi:ribosomal protein L37AE/L43A